MPECSFRPAVPGDETLLLDFIRALARYEQMEDQVTATPDILREWIFRRQKAEVIFPVVEGKEVGYALFFHNFSTFHGKAGLYLEDLFILPAFRGRGYGRALLEEVARVAVERGCPRLEWACLDWNRPSIDFYTKRMGATPLADWTLYRLTGEALRQAGNSPNRAGI